MAISTVKATINGTEYALTNSGGNTWTATVTAPGATSYNLAGGYYNVRVDVTNDAGTSATADGGTLEGLRLVVKETVKPVITIESPGAGAYITNNSQSVIFTLADETGGSGVDISTLTFKLDGAAQAANTLSVVAISGGYRCTWTPPSAMSDGAHSISVDVQDNDGNAATQATRSFTVDTVPPVLNITSPANGLITNKAALTITGTTNDATSSPVTLTIKQNGGAANNISVESDGSFTHDITLTDGVNTLEVAATDAAGRETTVTLTVKLDTSVPVVTSASITPNPANAGATVTIAVVIE